MHENRVESHYAMRDQVRGRVQIIMAANAPNRGGRLPLHLLVLAALTLANIVAVVESA